MDKGNRPSWFPHRPEQVRQVLVTAEVDRSEGPQPCAGTGTGVGGKWREALDDARKK